MDPIIRNALVEYLTENFSISDLANRLIENSSESQIQKLNEERMEWESRDLDGDV